MTPLEARRIVRTLRQGTVSVESAAALSIGTTVPKEALRREISRFQKSGSDMHPIVIQGDWGSGKSHLSMLLQGILAEHHVVWTRQAIDARGNSLAHLNRGISSWLGHLRIGGGLGIRQAIDEGVVDTRQASAWASARSSSFSIGLWYALNGSEWGWVRLLGHDTATPDNASQHKRAVELLTEAVNFLFDVQGSRTVLVLDELENVSREWDVRGRRRAYDTLGRFMEVQSMKLVLFVTDFFIEMVEADLQRSKHEDRWTSEARKFLRAVLDAHRVPIRRLTGEDAMQLVERIGEIYSTALGHQVRGYQPAQVREVWGRTATRSTRLLVRLAVEEMDVRASA